MPATATATTTALRPMGTGTSSRRAAVALLTLGLAGCGGSSATSSFAWLRPQPPPSGWKVLTIPSGARLAYPPTWRALHGDPGTATVAFRTPAGRFLGYLNLTPRQGAETLSNWATFRTEHNAEEGDRRVRRLASAEHLRFRSGQGSCVKDSYTTITAARYVEIACLVRGVGASFVIVGAAPPDAWGQVSPVIERAIASV